MKQKLLKMAVLFLLASIMLLSACSSPGIEEEVVDPAEVDMGEVIAKVNGENIYELTHNKITNRMMAAFEQQGMLLDGEAGEEFLKTLQEDTLQHLIQQEVLMQEARKKDLVVTDEQIDREIEILKSQFPSENEFHVLLERTLFTELELRHTIRTELTIEALLSQEIPADFIVTDEELEAAYSFHEAQFKMQMENLNQDGRELSEEELALMTFPPFEAIKENMRADLQEEKYQKHLMSYIDQLMEASEIDIH